MAGPQRDDQLTTGSPARTDAVGTTPSGGPTVGTTWAGVFALLQAADIQGLAPTWSVQNVFNAPAGTKKVLIKADATGADNALEAQTSGGTAYFKIGPPNLPNDASQNWLNITGTFPTVPTAAQFGAFWNLTSAGSASKSITGLFLNIAAGYTGSSATIAVSVTNQVAGTGATYAGTSTTSSYRVGNANKGGAFAAQSTTTGVNLGLSGLAGGGSANYGLWGSSTTAINSAVNVGVLGFALNTGTSPTACAGYFALADYGTSAPSVANAAVIADNGATSSSVFLGRVNGTTMWSLDSTGNPTWADGVNLIAGTSTGSKIGTATTQKWGFWNATPIVQPAGAGQAAVTDSTGGVAASSLVDVTTAAVSDPTKVNANFATVAVLLLAIRTALLNAGLIKGAA